jgi:predicted ABC-type ATPase
MPDPSPSMVVVAGPNGSGKSTSAPRLLRDWFGVREFVNADVIAQGLSAFQSDSVAVQAGRIMMQRLRELASHRATFAFETTLAARGYLSWIEKLRDDGYLIHLLFLWLPSPEVAIARVAARVREGGHGIEEAVIRRRYDRGLRNLIQLDMPAVDTWRVLDGTSTGFPSLIAAGGSGSHEIHDHESWQRIQEAARE